MYNINIKIKLVNENCLPKYSTTQSCCMDCFANLKDDVVIKPGETKLIPLGFKLELPRGFYVDISPRSGLSIKNNITLENAVGKVDSDFRDEVCALVHNDAVTDFVVTPIMKICQMMVLEYPKINLVVVDDIAKTNVEHKGFGSTGN